MYIYIYVYIVGVFKGIPVTMTIKVEHKNCLRNILTYGSTLDSRHTRIQDDCT